MAPGVNRLGRETGTVPKTKTPNNSGRDNAMGVSRTSRSNIPNNLTTQDWQSASGPSTNRTRKNSNTRASLLDYYDPPDGRIAHENSRFASSENQDQCGSVNKVCGEINGIEASPPTISVRRDCVRGPPRNVMPDTENKSNITKMNGAVLKTADSSRCNELRMRLEESQKKLQAMQEHQAALQALQQQTQQQLKEARAAQSTLLARTAAAAAAAATTTASSMNSDEDPNPETLRSNLDTIRDRLYALQMYEQRNPDKLQELQTKKERMDHLVAEFQTETNGAVGPAAASLQGGREKSGESSKDGSEAGDDDGNNSDIECDVQRVRHKMAQLSAMRAQLRRLQNMVDSGLQDTEMTGVQDGCPVHVEEIDGEEVEEEEAVNIRRQRQGKGRSVSRTNSTSSTATKPDNISQASVGHIHESELRIEKKTQKLREAKTKLHQLQKLLTTVMDLRSRGEPVPEHYLQILEEETTRVDQEQAAEAVQAAQEARAQQQANMDRDREGATALIPITGAGPTQESSEVTLEMVQAMALELQTQTQCLKEEKERLMRARQEIGNMSRELPYREKKTNTQMLLQAKRRELEELMRKDQGQSSAVNQDICSEVSAGKSDTAGFSYIGEGTSAATWGGSTQGTLDDLAERDDDVQEQSAGYSRETLSMSLESGVFGGSQCGNVNSNAGSISGTFPPPQSLTGLAPQRSGPRNVWRKSSTDSSATLPRAVWTPSSQHPNTVDELATNANTTAVNTTMSHNENESNASNITQVNQSQSTTSSQNNWWQQQAMQLQSQLDATNNLYQSLLLEQQQQQQNLACWPQPPALAHLPGFRGPLPGAPSDAFYQQLLAATQFQQQQLLLTTLNQCCHLLWMQQREMASLRGIVMSLQDKLSRGNEGYPSTITFSQQPEDSLLISSAHTSAHQTPRQSQSNLSHSNANSTPVPNAPHSHPPLKVSYSGGLIQPPDEHNSSSGAFSFHSLPNLPHPPLLGPCFHDPSAILNNGPNCSNRTPQPQPLTQCSVPQAATHGAGGAPWLQQGSAGGAPGLLSAHASSASPVPALNNQVPPGNRANNYWDNFRSYSRQNLLSTSTKSNEGVSHSPSPLVDRSRNTLRNSAGLAQPHPSQHATYPMPDQGLPLNLSRKEKLNIERYHTVPDNYALPSGGIPDLAELQYPQSLPNNQYLSANMQVEHQQIGTRALPSSVSNNMSSSDGRGTSSWQNRPSTRSYRTQRGMNCKRKNPRLPPAAATEHPLSSSSVASTPQDRGSRKHRDALCHRSGRSLFDVLSESVYTEVAALIAVNESRPHFLIQLFRDLQMVSSDPLRQRTLQSIHELVSRYLSEASGGPEGSHMHQNMKACKSKEPTLNDSLVSSDDDDNNTKQGHNEWELEAVLEDLLPFLKGHLDEICSPALLDAVRQQAVQLMLAQTQSHCRHNMPGSTHQPAGGYFQGQLDALLEDGLNKFQGCRLRDVCEDLLMVITDILQSELTFLKLVDTVRREVDESSEDTCKNPTTSEEPSNSVHTLQLSVESAAQAFPPPDVNCQNRLESLGSAEGYNGDLAEADQSHHEEATGGGSPQQIEDVAGAIVPEDSDDDGLLEIMQNDVLRPEENQDGLAVALSREDCEEHAKTEAEDEWAVEQDREQGLDRVPTRLTDEIDGQDRPSMLQTNHSDASSNP
ncbi:Putative casein kinase serine/threonine/tyrosine protein kinase [Gryllus bimaculatus]|nr:Putative casein kinase serine/threonine/tyrosine protein kinase [Gryllus bimaculatus]